MKPVLFIGSSSESLDVAYAAQENLEDCAQVIVWTQGLFSLSKGILESLLDTLDESNFGLFVFAPNDLVNIRGQNMRTTRDNVIFELGLFIGRLGRQRTYMIAPKDVEDLRVPSDLLGINIAQYAPPENPRFLRSALGPACNRVRRTIQEESASSSEPDELGLALSLVLPETQRKHLWNLATGNTKQYEGRGSMRAEIRALVSLGLVEKLLGRNIGEMESGHFYDLADFVKLTDLGQRFVERVKPARPKGPS